MPTDATAPTAPSGDAASFAALQAEVEALRARESALRKREAELVRERDVLRAAYTRLQQEVELLRRRIFMAKSERVDSTQLELEFAEKLKALETLAKTEGMGKEAGAAKGKGERAKPKGRRPLKDAAIEERRVEIDDPLFEDLVAQGKAERIGFEESYKLGWQRGGVRKVVVARVKYRTVGANAEAELETAPMPAELFPRSLAAPSLLAHVAIEKHCDGLPLFRIEERMVREGVSVDRGTMARWLEDLGATLGATVVDAMREDAMRTAFCIATDATGVSVQPLRTPAGDKQRRPCARGHFFVQIADRDHILYEYTPKETSAAVSTMFAGFTGYIQADAKSVYDALFRDDPPLSVGDDRERAGPDETQTREVGCWSHARRKYWEATVAKIAIAREGLARIGRIFELDASWRAKPPAETQRLRDAHLRPHVDAFFEWANVEYAKVENERGLLRDALGYSVRQKAALTTFLRDGRLPLDNNRSERALRTIAVGRKAWLFVGSDDHAHSAANIFTVIASARLHRLDPEQYLKELIRALAVWPRERHLELAPKYWATTRARLSSAQLETEVGPLDVPPLLPTSSPASDTVASRISPTASV